MPDEPADRDLPLKEDTRLLGRLLGDVLREQTGEDGYARVEAIRQTAIRFRRASAAEADAVRAELSALLNPLPIPEALHVVRAFSYFSHLANLAEDVHQNRRRRAHALSGSPPQKGSIEAALAHLTASGVGAEALVRVVRRGARVAGADRASDRSAAQEHPRLRARTRAAPALARPHALHAGRDGRLGARRLPAGADAVADGDAAAVEAHRARRDRQRPRVLPLHVPGRGAAALRDDRGAARADAGRRGAAAAVPAHGIVDRRRPRRQPVRRRGDARLRDPRAGRAGVRALPR